MIQELGNALAFVILAALLPFLILYVARAFRPSYPHTSKFVTYECGELPRGSAYIRFNTRFYMVAIVFLVFDVEVAMLFPVMTLYKDAVVSGQGLTVFLLAFNFLIMLFLGLVYEWKVGDIDWVKDFLDRKAALQKKGRVA
jgi:NADH-quinone oxidoreductase subunit A